MKHLFSLPFLILSSYIIMLSQNTAYGANKQDTAEVELDPVLVIGKRHKSDARLIGNKQISDRIIYSKDLENRGANIGDALNGELGIHANQYGAGASSPIIRGHEGKRAKILQSGSETLDMSLMAPDHAVTVDTLLAKRVEILRGANSLQYSSGNVAGLINVVDNKIPTEMPEDKADGKMLLRYNSGNREKLWSGGATFALGNHMALRLEGLQKNSDDYRVPDSSYTETRYHKRYAILDSKYRNVLDSNGNIMSTDTPIASGSHPQGYQTLPNRVVFEPYQTHHNHVKNSYSDSKVFNVGLSWIGTKGYLGGSYSYRKDNYGLPAHYHLHDGFHAHVLNVYAKPYLKVAPQLAEDEDILYRNPTVACAVKDENGVWCGLKPIEYQPASIMMTNKRYDVRGELRHLPKYLDKIKISATHSHYHHDELHNGSQTHAFSSYFDNKAQNFRLEFVHKPVGRWTGAWGLQFLRSENGALSDEHIHNKKCDFKKKGNCLGQQTLTSNTSRNWSIFALGEYRGDKLDADLGIRLEKQKIAMKYDEKKIRDNLCNWACKGDVSKLMPDLSPHQSRALSVAGSVNYRLTDKLKLGLIASHQERIPNAQELYTHGIHVASSAFEIGNKNLKNEKSNNIELGLQFQNGKLDYKISTFYNHFSNYIYMMRLNTFHNKVNGNLKMLRYIQAPARFYGIEGQVGYQINPTYHVSLSGDFVQGKLTEGPKIDMDKQVFKDQENGGYVPRLSPARMGLRIKAHFNPAWSGDIEYFRTFAQKRTSLYEDSTPANHLLNAKLSYRKMIRNQQFEWFMQANNLLNKPIYSHTSFLSHVPQMGRHINMGVKFEF